MTENKSITLYVCNADVSTWNKPKLVECPALSTDKHYVLGWDPDNCEAMNAFGNYRIIAKSEAHLKGYRESKREAVEAAIQYVSGRLEILANMNASWGQKSAELGELYLSIKE
jgi:hypothetical protein